MDKAKARIKVEIRVSLASELTTAPSKFSKRGMTLLIDGEVAAMCVLHLESGAPYATFEQKRPIPARTLHRFGIAAYAGARAATKCRFLAVADRAIPRAAAWLERLGFEELGSTHYGRCFRSRG